MDSQDLFGVFSIFPGRNAVAFEKFAVKIRHIVKAAQQRDVDDLPIAVLDKLRSLFQPHGIQIAMKALPDLGFEKLSRILFVDEIKAANKERNERASKGAGLADEDVDTQRYWLYSPGDGATKWEEF